MSIYYLQSNGQRCLSFFGASRTRRGNECKRFIGAVFWINGGCSQPIWNSVYKRFARWCERRMHQHFVDDPDMENLIIPPQAPSVLALPKTYLSGIPGGELESQNHLYTSHPHLPQRVVRCRTPQVGSPKVHVSHASGNRGTRGQLMPESEHVIADRAYAPTGSWVDGSGAVPVIPPRSNRREPHSGKSESSSSVSSARSSTTVASSPWRTDTSDSCIL